MSGRVVSQEQLYVTLSPSALYRAPTGRLCRYVPDPTRENRYSFASFIYVESREDVPYRWGTGFSLGWRNFHLLQVVE